LDFADRAEVITGDVRRALALLDPQQADIIFADPPYRSQLAGTILNLVDKHQLLSTDGVLAIEHQDDCHLLDLNESLVHYDRRKYGQTAISFYRRRD
jgi:16S rRNA G966 N2-methylase RsmD